jgi:hypothetical protein
VVEPGVDPGTFRFSDPNATSALHRRVSARAVTCAFALVRGCATARADTVRHAADAGISRDARDFRGMEAGRARHGSSIPRQPQSGTEPTWASRPAVVRSRLTARTRVMRATRGRSQPSRRRPTRRRRSCRSALARSTTAWTECTRSREHDSWDTQHRPDPYGGPVAGDGGRGLPDTGVHESRSSGTKRHGLAIVDRSPSATRAS